MLEHRPFSELAGSRTDWLNAKHHFPFGGSRNPAHLPIGKLFVWNDDEVAPGSGFPPHPHRDAEIITYVRQGVITHEDSLGNKGETRAGDVQVMSAGRGIRHSEWNAETETTRLFQIWIEPKESGGEPGWGAKPFPKSDRSGQFVPLASGSGAEGALPIRSDAEVYGAMLAAGNTAEFAFAPGWVGYLVPAAGVVLVNGVRLNPRDGLAIQGEASIRIEAEQDAELVLVTTAE